MKRWMILLMLSLIPVVSRAQLNALPSAPHLLVKGHAEGHYVPDRFTIKLLVVVVDKVPAHARAKVETYMRQIFSALEKNGALPGQTQASSLSIGPKTENSNDKEVFVGTEVSRTVNATFDSADKLSGFVANVNANGELQVSETEVARSDADALQQELRKRAIVDSQQSAKEIAGAYGLTIKGVYSVSEVAPDYSYGMRSGRAAVTVSEMTLPGVALRVGTIELEQDIYAVYLTSP